MAGAAVPSGLPGRSFAPVLTGDVLAEPRRVVLAEWHTEWGTTVEPGRMLRSERYKYTVYREEDGEELFDLAEDPGETRNLAPDPGHADVLCEHRRLLAEAMAATDDDFGALSWLADPRWRSHAPGYHAHVGSCAPMAAGVCG